MGMIWKSDENVRMCVMLFLAYLLVQGTVTNAVDELVKGPKNATVSLGQNVTLPCEFKTASPDCIWVHNGTVVIFQNNDRYHMLKKSKELADCSMVIQSFNITDTGSWKCQKHAATSQTEAAESATIYLNCNTCQHMASNSSNIGNAKDDPSDIKTILLKIVLPITGAIIFVALSATLIIKLNVWKSCKIPKQRYNNWKDQKLSSTYQKGVTVNENVAYGEYIPPQVYTASAEPMFYEDTNPYDKVRWSKASVDSNNGRYDKVATNELEDTIQETLRNERDTPDVILRDNSVPIPDPNAYVTVEACNIATSPRYQRKKVSSFQIGLRRFCENIKPTLVSNTKEEDSTPDEACSNAPTEFGSDGEVYANVKDIKKDIKE